MENLINYIIYSSLCMGVFLLFYLLILKKETCFRFNRFYLLGSSFIALLVPLFKIPILNARPVLDTIPTAVTLPSIVVIGYGHKLEETGSTNYLSMIILAFYLAGVIFLSYRLLYEVWKIYFLSRSLPKQKNVLNINLIQTRGAMPTFSFMNYIFWNEEEHLSESEKKQILLHEQVHIKEKHTLDILYFEFISILFWPNFLIRLFKREIVEVHEFLADRKVIHNHDLKSYSSLLAKQCLKQMEFSLVHSFSKAGPLKRIKMMESLKKPASTYKMILTIPVLIITLLTISCMKEEKEPLLENEIVEEPLSATQEVFSMVEDQPVPEGGIQSLYEHLMKNIQYPKEARKAGIEGKVFVEFIVNTEGLVRDVKVVKGIGGGCDEEAIRVIKNSPRWKPGFQRGEAVNVRMILPVTFKLD